MDIANTPSRTRSAASRRKAKHLEICLERSEVETGDTLFGEVRFIHQALPELDLKDIDVSTEFLGLSVSLPLFISCMTGGSVVGKKVNRELALAAQELRIPLGLGSISILFSDDGAFEDFHVKPYARDVPVIANIGAVRLRDTRIETIEEILNRLEVQALAVHLNPGQELFQEEGDRDFRGLADAIRAFADRSSYPVLVKETGFGIRPRLASLLLDAGVRYVDVAGAGGTNWSMVESLRDEASRSPDMEPYVGWGIPTALLLAAVARTPLPGTKAEEGSRILASGGVRNAGDIAKSIALGAEMAGMALPFIRTVVAEGSEGVVKLVEGLRRDLVSMMLLVGAANIGELARTPLWFSPAFLSSLESFLSAEGGGS